MPKICDENCFGQECAYDVCPFLYEYKEKDERCPGNSGYRYVGDPVKDKKIEWAIEFQKNHSCGTCPFVIDAVDIGVGILYHCEYVCKWKLTKY